MLVICTMGYGSAWAYDGHAVDLDSILPASIDVESHSYSDHASSNHGSSDSSLNENNSEQSIADVHCDHCGHISAHLQAIFTQSSYLCCVNQSSELSEYSEAFISFIVSPDRRPPRI